MQIDMKNDLPLDNCKNCKHWEQIKECTKEGLCTNYSAFKSISEVITDADNFCKYFESNSIHLASFIIDNTEMFKELDVLKKEFYESGLSIDEFLKKKKMKNQLEKSAKNLDDLLYDKYFGR